MSKIKIILLLFFVPLAAFAQDVDQKLGDFNAVKVLSGLEVKVIPGNENKIVITGHSKDEVKFGVKEGELEIRLSLDNIWSEDNTKILVYGSSINAIDANQGSLVEVSGKLEAEELIFRAQEGANISAGDVEAQKIFSKAVTGGKVSLRGKAVEQEVEVNTGGHYYGKDLRTKQAEASAGTAGKAEIFATEYVKATAKLGGTVEIFGRPEEVDTKTSLGGRIL